VLARGDYRRIAKLIGELDGEKTWPPAGRTDGRTWGETDGH
jgi:hypothetical protein